MGKVMLLHRCTWAWFILLICAFATVAGLSCYRCQTHDCLHDYCNSTLQALSDAGAVHESLPLCPSTASKWNHSEYHEHCQLNEVCGHSILNVVTSYNSLAARNTSGTVFPVIVQVTHQVKSRLHVRGCMDAAQTTCPLYPQGNVTVRDEEARLPLGEHRYNRVIVTNTVSTCCQCVGDFCNKNETISSNHCSLATQSLILTNDNDGKDNCHNQDHEDPVTNSNKPTMVVNIVSFHGPPCNLWVMMVAILAMTVCPISFNCTLYKHL